MASGATINDKFFEEIGKSDPVVALCRDAATKVMVQAEATAEVDSGDYKRGFHLTVRESKYRTVVQVENDDPKTLIIESRTGNMARALKSTARGR